MQRAPDDWQRRRCLQAAGAGVLAWPAAAALAQGSAPATATTTASPGTVPYRWREVPFGGGGYVDGFVFHPRTPGLLYARTDVGGAYRYEPATQRWRPLLDHLGRADADLMGVLSLALDAADPARVYAACGLYTGEWARGAALLASSDGGASWVQHELPFKLGGNEDGRGSGERLQVDPLDSATLWLGSTQQGLWRSRDRGRRFERTGFPARHVSLVLCDARGGALPGGGCRTLWVGSHDTPGLYLSQDGGARFERVPGLPALAPQRAAFGPEGSLYVSFSGGEAGQVCNPGHARRGALWRRSPEGAWQDITPLPAQGFGYSGVAVCAQRPGRLLASTLERWGEGDEIFLSNDFGARWQPLSAHSRRDPASHPWLQAYLRGSTRLGHWISDVQIDPHDPQRVLYGTGYGLWMSTQLPAEPGPAAPVPWRFAVDGLEETAVLGLVSPSGGATLMAAMGDVSGAAWDDLTRGPAAGLFLPGAETNRSVDVAQLQPAVAARTSDAAATGGYVSVDGGVSWRPFGASAHSQRPAAQRGSAGTVAVSAGGGFFVWAPEKQAALCSRDRGRSWQACEGWPEDRSVALQPVADRSVEGVFYVLDRGAGRVLVSVDGGARFAPAVQGLPRLESWQHAQLVVAPGALRDLWLALPGGLLHLHGVEQPARAAPGVVEAWLVALGRGLPGAAYAHSVYLWGRVQRGAAVQEGLFRSDDGGQQWLRLNDDAHRYGRLTALAADPLEHGSVYLAPHGRGLVAGRPASAAAGAAR